MGLHCEFVHCFCVSCLQSYWRVQNFCYENNKCTLNVLFPLCLGISEVLVRLWFLSHPTPIPKRHKALHHQQRGRCGQSTPDSSTLGRIVMSLSHTVLTTFYAAYKYKDKLNPKVPHVSSSMFSIICHAFRIISFHVGCHFHNLTH